jgi:hypothetical protein
METAVLLANIKTLRDASLVLKSTVTILVVGLCILTPTPAITRQSFAFAQDHATMGINYLQLKEKT